MNNELVRDEAKRTIKNSAGRPGLNRLYTKYYRLTTNWHLYICRESSTNPPLFMQNKANFQNGKMNVRSLITVVYGNIVNWTLGENKPNSKPIQSQIKPNSLDAQMNVSLAITRNYNNEQQTMNNELLCKTNPINPTPSAPLHQHMTYAIGWLDKKAVFTALWTKAAGFRKCLY